MQKKAGCSVTYGCITPWVNPAQFCLSVFCEYVLKKDKLSHLLCRFYVGGVTTIHFLGQLQHIVECLASQTSFEQGEEEKVKRGHI